MSRRILVVALSALCCLAPGAVDAGQTLGHVPQRVLTGDLSLDAAVQLALRQNPEILKAFQEIERTRGQFIEIRAGALPHLGLQGNYSQQDKNLLERSGSSSTGSSSGVGTGSGNVTISQAGASSVTLSNSQFASLFQPSGQSGAGGDKSWQVTMQIQQAIYSGGQVRAGLESAKFTRDSSYWGLRDTVDRVIAQVRTQFTAILLNRALITVQEQSIQLLSDQLRDQQNRFEAGTVPRFNVLRAEVELSNARPDLIRARNNYYIAQVQLAKSLGLDPGPGGRPTFNAVGTLGTPERPIALTDALQLAKERRPSLKVQRQNILIEAEGIKIAQAGYKPRLNANAGYELRNSRLSNDLGDVVNGWFFGVSGSWAIFDGLETYGRTKQALARLESAKINYDDTVRLVELEVQQAFAGLEQARQTIQSQQKGVEQAVESLRLASERLSAGAGTQLDVLNARTALTLAQTTELQARADYNTALAEFDRATATDTVYDDTFQDPLSAKRSATGNTARPPAKSSQAPAAALPAK